MKLIGIVTTLGLVLASGTAQDFEGSVTFKVGGNGQAQTVEYFAKGDKIRLEMVESGGMKVILLLDATQSGATMLMPAQNMYMKMTEDMAPAMENASLDLQRTGKKETILGYVCEQVIVRQDQSVTEAWVTQGLGRFRQAGFTGGPKSPAVRKIEEELLLKGYFPLRMITRGPGGRDEVRMEATSIQKKKLSDDLFAIPSGYQHMQMPMPFR